MEITSRQRVYLRGLAQTRKPVVTVGQHGLTQSVVTETEAALARHELVKVRFLEGDRGTRREWYQSLCEATGATPVQEIGRNAVLYRPGQTPRIALP